MNILQKVFSPVRRLLSLQRSRPPCSRRPAVRCVARLLVIGLALTGAVSIGRTVLGPADVGHFRTVQGREEYVGYYQQAMEAMPAPSSVQDVATDFGTVRVYIWDAGNGAADRDSYPVVLLPGRSSGVPMWSANVSALIRSRQVIAFDALGDAGLSVQSVPLTSMEDQAAWIDQVVTAVAPREVHLVGHSFGGATATAYARLHPQRVRSLTLLEPVFTLAYPPAGKLGWVMVASVPGLPESLRDKALGRIAGEDFAGSDPMALMIKAGSEHFEADLPTPSPLTKEEANALTMPIYVAIAGKDSLAGGRKAAERAEELLPGARVQTWKDATHSLPMQEAEPLAQVLEPFWRQVESA